MGWFPLAPPDPISALVLCDLRGRPVLLHLPVSLLGLLEQNTTGIYFSVREATTSNVKVPAISFSGEESSWLADTAFLLCPPRVEREDSGFSLFLQGHWPYHGGSTLMISFKPKYLPKVSSFKSIILWVRALTFGFGGTKHSVHHNQVPLPWPNVWNCADLMEDTGRKGWRRVKSRRPSSGSHLWGYMYCQASFTLFSDWSWSVPLPFRPRGSITPSRCSADLLQVLTLNHFL